MKDTAPRVSENAQNNQFTQLLINTWTAAAHPLPPGFSAYGILQVSILEWVAIRPPGDLSDPGIELTSPMTPA